jgi:hypothetical protein
MNEFLKEDIIWISVSSKKLEKENSETLEFGGSS